MQLAVYLGLAGMFAGAAAPAVNEKIAPWVWEKTAYGGRASFLVVLTDQADLTLARGLHTKAEKGAYVVAELRAAAQATQGPILERLRQLGAPHRPFYIVNMIEVEGGLDLVLQLAARGDVARIDANPWVRFDGPVERSPASTFEPARGVDPNPEPNLLQVNADDVWGLGFTGQGMVLAGADTGVDWDHPALINQYRGSNGSPADHNFNWHDSIHVNDGSSCGPNATAPCDPFSHGTHTVGTMVGDDGGTNRIGMAPGAEWIACRNMNQFGAGTPATYTECFEWFIAPYAIGGSPAGGDPTKAPHAINNSWGCPPSEGCPVENPNILKMVVENTRAAGIMVVVSAGNAGSACETVEDPAAIYDASYSVGAVGPTDVIATFSSRGPVVVDGSNRLKPDISAPGVSILSSVPGTGYSFSSGTSMAGPHVAGAVGLLWSAEPDLIGDTDLTELILNQSALDRTTLTQTCGGVPGTSVPNNTYGWGRLDILAAVQQTPAGRPLAVGKGPGGSADKVRRLIDF
ncbi:MAG TPA: S8 family serine peptidase [Rhodospirillales bacterium]